MKQFVITLLAAFVLSAPAFGGNIGYDTGKFLSATMGGSFSSQLSIDITGSLNEIDIDTGKLVRNTVGCPPGASCFDFTGGFVNVDHGKFGDEISGGILISATGVATISAILAPETGVASGGAVTTFDFSGNNITFGSADVALNSTPVPEPTALSLLGIGFLSFLAFRRKVSLWR